MYAQLPMYQRQGAKAMKKDLSNTLALLRATGNPHMEFRAIHIAGTNGKGSVTHLVAAGLQAQGYRVGVYTSPHYVDFRERIKINGEFISKKKVINYVETIKPILDDIKPSFFEMTVGMAFKYFADEKLDYVVIETGLGGRLDSTNVLSPLLSVITNISLDHMDMLGDTLEKIAGEKAGIIKPSTPCLIGEYQSEVAHVFEQKAKEVEAPLYWAKELVTAEEHRIKARTKSILNYEITRKPGPFWDVNIRTACAALLLLAERGVDFSWNKFNDFLPDFATKVYYLGRWQWLSRSPDILLDSAHNEAGLSQTIQNVLALKYDKIHFVLGFSKDKKLEQVLPYFPSEADYYFVKANVPRGMASHLLSVKAEPYGLRGKFYSSVRRGLAAARRKCKPGELIYVGGSIFVVGEVLAK